MIICPKKLVPSPKSQTPNSSKTSRTNPLGMIHDGWRQLLFYSCRNNIIWPNAQKIKTLGFTSTLAWLYQLGPTCFLDSERFIMQQLRVVIIHSVWISTFSRALKRLKVLAYQKSPKLKVSFSSLVPSCPRCKILSINPTHRTHTANNLIRLWILAIEVFNTLELTMHRQYCPL